ncbi:MAG: hypothetical protein AABO41_15485 [Acidobacteriota bacterium]
MDDKIIVTNLGRLKAKYGLSGAAKIKAAVKKLAAADKLRGLDTRLIALDDAAAMKKLKAPPVTKAADPKQNKEAIDAVCKKLSPDYLVILGAPDVIPHQDLKNPVFDPPEEPDQFALSDLPYACEAPYSRSPENFTGPSRVVGRIPDLTGSNDPSYLIGLLDTATNSKSLPVSEYLRYHSISAKVWEASTRLSLDNMFGSNADLHLSPKKGPKWATNQVGRRVHFINCHGAEATSQFFGQSGQSFPIAHEAKLVKGKISEGTVASVECCYGAQLYDSSVLGDGPPICNTYLEGKAYGFFGSTTIAYGPAEGNGGADLICQFFVLQVLGGASLGRAALEAQQQFIASAPQMDPTDVKTMAQFILLGDPSIHPVSVVAPQTAIAAGTRAGKSAGDAVDRGGRRQQLHAKGMWLAKNQPVATGSGTKKRSSSVDASLKKIADKVNVKVNRTMSFQIKRGVVPKSKMAKAITPTAFHVALGVAPMKKARTPQVVAVVAKEVAGKIVSFRALHRR